MAAGQHKRAPVGSCTQPCMVPGQHLQPPGLGMGRCMQRAACMPTGQQDRLQLAPQAALAPLLQQCSHAHHLPAPALQQHRVCICAVEALIILQLPGARLRNQAAAVQVQHPKAEVKVLQVCRPCPMMNCMLKQQPQQQQQPVSLDIHAAATTTAPKLLPLRLASAGQAV